MAKNIDWENDHVLFLITKYAREGLSDKDIAKSMNVGYSTFTRKKADFEKVKEAVKIGKILSIPANFEKAENSLLSLCFGYQTRKEEITRQRVGTKEELDGNTVATFNEKVKITKMNTAPNIVALIFYLSNNYPDLYKNTHNTGGTDDKDKLTDKGSIIKFTEDMDKRYHELKAKMEKPKISEEIEKVQ